MKAPALDSTLFTRTSDEAMSFVLEQILRRLENLEHRIARLEAGASAGPAAPRASNADAFRASPATPGLQTVEGAPGVSRGRAAHPPLTLRLNRVPVDRVGVPFPDLSQLDEKLEPKKGPAERLQVRAALEGYPRISTRIQQLWGTPDCEAYLTSLVIDTRGNRRGFPPAVMEELLYLGRLARALVIQRLNGDLWDACARVGDRR